MSPLKVELMMQYFYYAEPNKDVKADPARWAREELVDDGLLARSSDGYEITTKGNRYVGVLTRVVPGGI